MDPAGTLACDVRDPCRVQDRRAVQARRHRRRGRRARRRDDAALRRGHRARRPELRVVARRAAGRADRPDAEREHGGAGRRRHPHHELLREQPHAGDRGPDLRGHEAGHRRHRGQPLLRPQRPRRPGHPARAGREHRRRRRGRGRLDADPAAGEADPAADRGHPGGGCGRRRADRRSQAARGAVGPRPGGDLLQGRDPHPLPEHRLLRRRRLRHPGRRPAVLLGERDRPDPAAGLGARRSGAEPDQRRPAGQPGERAGPPGRRAQPDARPRAHHRPGAGRHHRPARRHRRGAAAGPQLRRGLDRRVLLLLPAVLPDRDAGHDPAADRQRWPDDPDHPAPGHAGRRRPGRAEHPAHG
ncbi:unannotated protein [freshwater metagenome]|uniref:Unannotated protein n=1 Tax=freshwater metagenome TaxID=449393 RepID=A0A6J7HU65_9ZZZZ